MSLMHMLGWLIKQVVLLEGQQLQVRSKGADLSTDLGNELRVHHAFVRRGLALEMANLASYDAHEKVVREFMGHLTRSVPPGFKGPTIEAVLRADKELWTRVADEVRSNLRPDVDGRLPVDKAFEKFATSSAVLFHLLPLPGRVATQPEPANKRKTPESEPAGDKPSDHPNAGRPQNKNKRK